MTTSLVAGMARHPRRLAAVLAAASASALGAGLFVQYVLGDLPCSLCVLQRLGFIGVLAFTLPIAALPLGRASVRFFAALALVAALAGLGVAIYQVWLGYFPAGLARCGRGPAAYFEDTPFEKLANVVLEAAGDCGKPVTFFGVVTMPQLGLAAFLALVPLTARMAWLSVRYGARRKAVRAETP